MTAKFGAGCGAPGTSGEPAVAGRVSVLIPCYNAEPFLSEAIRSALTQTYPDVEVVVVDDGSTDASVAVASAFDPARVHVIQQAHLGSCAARNRALDLATGEFIFYLDADDRLHPAAVRQLADALAGADAAYGDAVLVDGKGAVLALRSQAPGHQNAIISLLERAPLCGTVLIRRTAIRATWASRYDSIDEFVFFASLAVRGVRFAHVRSVVLSYRQHESIFRKSNNAQQYVLDLADAFAELADELRRRDQLTGELAAYFGFAACHFCGRSPAARACREASTLPGVTRVLALLVRERRLARELGRARVLRTAIRCVAGRSLTRSRAPGAQSA